MLPKDLAVMVHGKWYTAKNTPGGPGSQSEWVLFTRSLLSLMGYDIGRLALTSQVRYYNDQTWIVSLSKGCWNFTYPWGGGGGGQNVELGDFSRYWLCCHWGHLCFTNTSCFNDKTFYIYVASMKMVSFCILHVYEDFVLWNEPIIVTKCTCMCFGEYTY